ncbi:ECF transporter S component [Arthrobacter sp. NIO-1057]|uniref:ECF transporter S component n=1 Tax=Arthrobacter sp. NIO-1057 TaxID=993071 RepID=UPI0008179C10|nr:ECF transporter S component [Arthrobacter sp. NIO-1057]SCC01126.1 energy-coupling factor transport system substrate-specific component [Arthrobacter sp. NIO-1057]
MEERLDASATRDSLDAVVGDLQLLRLKAGEISYAEIVRRIAKIREAKGMDPAVSKPARTTVYDAFRPGRSRVNVTLVGEIVLALGCTEAEAQAWKRRCIEVRSLATIKQLTPETPVAALPAQNAPLVAPPTIDELPKGRSKARLDYRTLILCLAINVLGFWTVSQTGIPLYLDMIGTAVAAILYGPWIGAGIGLSTNLIGLGITDGSSAAFSLVNIAGALVWGYGAMKIRKNNYLCKFVILNVLVAIVCSLLASVLLVLIFGGGTGHGSEVTMNTLLAKTNSLAISVFHTNIIYSLADKLLTGLLSLTIISALGKRDQSPISHDIECEVENLLRRQNLKQLNRFLSI